MKFKLILIITVFFELVSINGFSQISFVRDDSLIILNQTGDTLTNSTAGGMNFVQFSEIDINIDGVMDLISFDRTGNRLSTFINGGTPNKVDYRFNYGFINKFPPLSDWVLLRDFNCDGKMDVFTSYSGGIMIYENTSLTSLTFNLFDSILISNFSPDSINPSLIPIFVSSSDIPIIDDIDNDLDLDILTFDLSGNYLQYHKNLSQEIYGNCDSLTYELRNKCWGYFKESNIGNTIQLFDTCSFNINNPEKNSIVHAGSTLLSLDINSDGYKDIVVGDALATNLTLLTNGDTSSLNIKSIISNQDVDFPMNNNSTNKVKIDGFPSSFYFDVNNDSVDDLIVTSNCDNGCENFQNVWLYNNLGLNSSPNFVFDTTSFIQGSMLEVGEGVHPVFFDHNSDGLLDLIIGNYGIYDVSFSQNYKSTLWLYENTGTINTPVYKLITDDYAGVSSLNLNVFANQPTIRLAPTFGDLDGDGDVDMLIGDFMGYLHYFENTAGIGNTANFILNQAQYKGIDVGNFASPLIVDLNRDSLLDLIIGNQLGYFSFYKNIGTSTNPIFQKETDSLGNVSTKRYGSFNGNSTPLVIDVNGNYKMFSGSSSGYIYKFENIDGNLNGTFSLDSSFLNIWDGVFSAIAISDLNNDNIQDMILGNYSGGISYYKGDGTSSLKEKNINVSTIYSYPNPTENKLTIDFGANNLDGAELVIFNYLGELIFTANQLKNITKIDFDKFDSGVYFATFINRAGSKTIKIIKL